MPTTIYSRLNDREFVYSRNDLRKIAYWTHEKYVKEFEQDPDKIEQDEEGRIFQVFAYPDEWAEIIDEITDWYFKKKRKIGDNHIKREERAKEIKAQREKRIAEGKFERALPEIGNEKYAPRKPKGQAKGKPNPNNSKGKGPFKPKQDPKKKPGASNSNPKPYSKQGTGQSNNANRPKQQGQGGGRSYSQNRYSNNQNNNSRNYNSNPNVQTRQDRSTFNSFESDINSEYNYNKGFAAKYKSGPTPRASYYETPSETKFTKKVEIDLGNSTSADGTKKRKRIAKALFVAAPEPNDSKE